MEERERESGSLLGFHEMERNRDLRLKIDGIWREVAEHVFEIDRVLRKGFAAVVILEVWRGRKNRETARERQRERREQGLRLRFKCRMVCVIVRARLGLLMHHTPLGSYVSFTVSVSVLTSEILYACYLQLRHMEVCGCK